MSNLNTPPMQWLKELFGYEYCDECGGDAEHHYALPLLGNWFALCKFPCSDDGEFHQVVKEFRCESTTMRPAVSNVMTE